jgi:hypothetical protein
MQVDFAFPFHLLRGESSIMRTLTNTSRTFSGTLLLAACAVSCLGCGGKEKIVSVTGRVTHNDNPVPNITVSFVPQEATETGVSTGKTDENGRYKLYVAKTGGSGAVVGSHKVWVSLPRETAKPVDKDEKMVKKREEKKNKKKGSLAAETLPADTAQILKKYGRLDKTPLTVEVKGDPIDLKLD